MNRLLDRYFDWNIDRQRRWEKDAVRGVFHAGSVLLYFGVYVVFLVVFFVTTVRHDPVAGLLRISMSVMGLYAGLGVSAAIRERKAFRRGWFHGRSAMVDAMEEAQRRGMPFPVWILTEAERETINAMGGIPYPLPRPEEDA